jgi:hypothetical protein
MKALRRTWKPLVCRILAYPLNSHCRVCRNLPEKSTESCDHLPHRGDGAVERSPPFEI